MLFLFFVFELFTRSTTPFSNIAFTILSLIYVVLPFTLLHYAAYSADGTFQPGIILGFFFFFFSSRRRHTRCSRDWSSDVCSSDLAAIDQNLPRTLLRCDHLQCRRKIRGPRESRRCQPAIAAGNGKRQIARL